MSGQEQDDDLEPLVTRCPGCDTRFRVTEAQLHAADGRVRCGACLNVFQGIEHLLWEDKEAFANDAEAKDALDQLLDELGQAAAAESEPAVDGTLPNLEALGRDLPGSGGPLAAQAGDDFAADPYAPTQLYGGFEDVADEALSDSETANSDQVPDLPPVANDGHVSVDDAAEFPAPVAAYGSGEHAVVSSQDGEQGVALEAGADGETLPAAAAWDDQSLSPSALAGQASSTGPSTDAEAAALTGGAEPISFAREPRRLWVPLIAAGFVAALIVQVFYFQLPSWSLDPGLRPIYEIACRWLGCQLPLMRDLKQMSTRDLAVLSHPELDGALVVNAVIVNEAGFPQPFPDLELKFSAVGGVLVARRQFTPAEYLAGELEGATEIPPRTPIQIALEIQDPGSAAVNYTLTFR